MIFNCPVFWTIEIALFPFSIVRFFGQSKCKLQTQQRHKLQTQQRYKIQRHKLQKSTKIQDTKVNKDTRYKDRPYCGVLCSSLLWYVKIVHTTVKKKWCLKCSVNLTVVCKKITHHSDSLYTLCNPKISMILLQNFNKKIE